MYFSSAETWTLSKLLETLETRLPELDLLHHIQQTGIEPWCVRCQSSAQASRLLAVLYDTLRHCDTMGLHSHTVSINTHSKG